MEIYALRVDNNALSVYNETILSERRWLINAKNVFKGGTRQSQTDSKRSGEKTWNCKENAAKLGKRTDVSKRAANIRHRKCLPCEIR